MCNQTLTFWNNWINEISFEIHVVSECTLYCFFLQKFLCSSKVSFQIASFSVLVFKKFSFELIKNKHIQAYLLQLQLHVSFQKASECTILQSMVSKKSAGQVPLVALLPCSCRSSSLISKLSYCDQQTFRYWKYELNR